MAFFTLKNEVQDQEAGLPSELVQIAANIRTDLDYFDNDEIFLLQYHGYTLIDSYIKRYAKDLIQTEDTELKWHEEFSADRIAKYKHLLRKSHKRRIRPHKF